MKHSFYPSPEIEEKLREDAKRTHRTIRKVLSDIVEAYYTSEKIAEAEGKSAATNLNAECTSAVAVSQEIETPAPPSAPIVPAISEALLARHIRYIDNRSKGGKLWALGDLELAEIIQEVQHLHNCRFVYVSGGSKATKNRPGWYLT